jgi:hypothetical protein
MHLREDATLDLTCEQREELASWRARGARRKPSRNERAS